MHTNPFKFGTVVSGNFFYNREDELQRIKQVLIGGNNITLYAPRRYGKTSLVNKVLRELDEEGFTTVYLDMMSVYSRETFIKNYTGTIAGKLGKSLETVIKKIARYISGIVPSLAFDSAGNPAFSLSWVVGEDKDRTLSDVINLPEKLATDGKKWIVVFDEFQEITKQTALTFDLGAVSSTQKALGVFIEDGIIEQFKSKYEFADPLYKKFVQQTL